MKKLFGKRALALLTTMAILVSLVAMLGGLSVTSGAAYEPKRAVTVTTSAGIHQACLMLTDAYKVAPSQTITVSGYYKVDSLSGTSFSIGGTSVSTDAATDGWVAFSFDYAAPAGEDWKSFGIYNEVGEAAGTFALADITFTNALGQVVYDMATDAALSAGTYNYTKSHGYDKQSLFYLMGTYGMSTKADATATIVVDPVYTEPYAPMRTISMTTAGTQINGKICLYYTSNLGAGKEITVKGYYKIDNYAAARDDHKIWSPDGKEHFGNCDWTPFEKTFTSGNGHNLCLEYWYAQGTISLADIAIYEGETRIYDMTTDENLVAGTYDSTNWKTDQGLWYFGYYQGIDQATYTIDPIYVPETYTPKRVLSMTTAGTQINGKIYLYNSNLLGSGKKVVAKGYYKVENYTVADASMTPRIISDALGDMTADCDWTPFEIEFTTGSGKALDLEFWFVQGTISFADVTIKEVDGDYLYDMTTDADMIAGTYDASNWAINQGIWYLGYYQGIDQATYTIGEKAEGGLVIIPPPYDPEVVELPEIPNLIVADKNGYTPNRAFAIIKGVHKSPKVTYGVFADETNYAVAGNKYYVFLKYGAGDMNGVEATISINGTVVKTLTANTEAWETLLDENGKPYSFEAVEVDDIVSIVFQVKGEGTGNFAIADLIIADQTGKIVYSLANDKTMHINSDMRYVENGYWKGDPYVAEVEGPTLMPIQTKVETYKPNAYISLTQNDKKKGTTDEAFLFLRTDNALFTAGQKYTVKGMIKVDIDAGYGGWGNASLGIGPSAGISNVTKVNILDTNGAWLPLLTAEGKPVTFTGAAGDFFKINLFKTYGTVALADIQILDAQGNVVYDMVTDEALKALEGEYSGNVADLGGAFVHALYNNGVGEIFFADSEQTNTETSKQIPTFEETVEVPKEEEVPCDHDFVDGKCTKCGEADPDYVPECDHDFVDGTCTKCGEADPDYVPECDHNFVDGVCDKCGETDPNYNPGGEGPIEPPAQTGDENMFFVMALGTLAVISLAALTLNKKFHA